MTTRYALAFVLTAVGLSCKDSAGPQPLGPPANMAITAGNATAPANTDLTGLTLVVRDANNQPLPNQTVTFAVTEGGGSIQQTSATTGADGTLTVPPWRLGKLAVPQKLRATVAAVTFDIVASVQTSYDIVLRFYGSPGPTPEQEAMFHRAAARTRAVIVNDLANVSTGGNFDISSCTPGQQTVINETIDDVVIYVNITAIDGPGKILASAGPCFVRSGKNAAGQGGVDSLTTVIGLMRFDSADLPNLREELILHEMLHVVGFGAMWGQDGWKLVINENTPDPRYIGPNGVQGCRDVGATVTCANSVPVEDTLGPGTAGVHWDENAFRNELMTGFAESAATPMPMSIMTVRSLLDIGYKVNLANVDPYTKPSGLLAIAHDDGPFEPWETRPPVPVIAIDPNGKPVKVLRPR